MSAISDSVKLFSEVVPAGAYVLDVGCGLRPYEKFFTNAKYIGIDVAVSGRSHENKCPDIVFDGVNIPLRRDAVGAVICTEVLEHAVDPASLLAEIHRVLISDGQLLITVPFIWGLHELPYDYRRYTLVGIVQLVEKAGFIVEKQGKLTEGIDAVKMLIDSEIHNYLNSPKIVNNSNSSKLKIKLAVVINRWLLRFVTCFWQRVFKFERIYIDNIILAKKSRRQYEIS